MIVQEPIVSKDFIAAVDMTRLQVEYKYSLVAYVVLRTAYNARIDLGNHLKLWNFQLKFI